MDEDGTTVTEDPRESAPGDEAPESKAPETGAEWQARIDDPKARAAAAKFTSPAAMARSYHELEKRLGGAVTLPREGADAEEWEAFYNRIGRPEHPEGYELDTAGPGEGLALDADALATARGLFHRHGLTKAQAEGLFRDYVALEGERLAREGEIHASQAAEAEARLRRRWGADYAANLTRADRAFRHYFGDRAEQVRQMRLADGTLLGNHPWVIEAFSAVGRETGEDRFRSGAPVEEETREALTDRLAALRRKPDHEMTDADRAEKRRIYVRLYGTAPADGRIA